jgi:hypothetical protein
MRGDRCPDGGGKAIALEKSFNQSQHSIHWAIKAYYCSLRITALSSTDGDVFSIITDYMNFRSVSTKCQARKNLSLLESAFQSKFIIPEFPTKQQHNGGYRVYTRFLDQGMMSQKMLHNNQNHKYDRYTNSVRQSHTPRLLEALLSYLG